MCQMKRSGNIAVMLVSARCCQLLASCQRFLVCYRIKVFLNRSQLRKRLVCGAPFAFTTDCLHSVVVYLGRACVCATISNLFEFYGSWWGNCVNSQYRNTFLDLYDLRVVCDHHLSFYVRCITMKYCIRARVINESSYLSVRFKVKVSL
jgi:hypothetical protein